MKKPDIKKLINKKTLAILIAVLAVIIALVVVLVVRRGKKSAGDDVYIDTVAAIMGEEEAGEGINRFAGVAESKQSWQVKLDEGSSVGKILVSEGDEVKEGTPLFTYDTNKMSENQTQAEIDLQRLKNERTAISETITQLNAEKRAAGAADKGSYTIQIQEQELAAKQKDIEISEKQKELDKIKASVKNATVTSKIDGVVKSINRSMASDASGTDEETEDMGMDQGSDTAFMTIMQTSQLQIKASVNEQNVASLEEGAAVIVHSRVDDTTWEGTISKIDSESPKANAQTDMMSDDQGGSEETSSSTYPFYVELESSEGLMLGQHVFIELAGASGSGRSGIWLDEMFIVGADGDDPYVLAESSNGKLKKRPVTLGDYDEELMQFEITEGLTKKDRIAMPDMAEE